MILITRIWQVMFDTNRARFDKILSTYPLLINYNLTHQLHGMSIGI